MPDPTTTSAEPASVRILIPDHPDLYRVLGADLDLTAELRATSDPGTYDDGVEPWQLPEQLLDPRLESTRDAILDPAWIYDVGDEQRDTAIELHHAGVQHMGVYLATATHDQLELLRSAGALLARAGDPHARRFQRMADLADFLDQLGEAEHGKTALRGWQITLGLLEVATAPGPIARQRPQRLLDPAGRALPPPNPAGTSPAADTATLLARIDGAPSGLPVELDTEGFLAFRRLTVEWHALIYGDHANDTHAQLASMTY